MAGLLDHHLAVDGRRERTLSLCWCRSPARFKGKVNAFLHQLHGPKWFITTIVLSIELPLIQSSAHHFFICQVVNARTPGLHPLHKKVASSRTQVLSVSDARWSSTLSLSLVQRSTSRSECIGNSTPQLAPSQLDAETQSVIALAFTSASFSRLIQTISLTRPQSTARVIHPSFIF